MDNSVYIKLLQLVITQQKFFTEGITYCFPNLDTNLQLKTKT